MDYAGPHATDLTAPRRQPPAVCGEMAAAGRRLRAVPGRVRRAERGLPRGRRLLPRHGPRPARGRPGALRVCHRTSRSGLHGAFVWAFVWASQPKNAGFGPGWQASTELGLYGATCHPVRGGRATPGSVPLSPPQSSQSVERGRCAKRRVCTEPLRVRWHCRCVPPFTRCDRRRDSAPLSLRRRRDRTLYSSSV
jgi:hypothetical protein